jgi:hypothetical protein
VRLILAISLLISVLFTASSASAATALTCPTTIRSGGTYVLTADLTCSAVHEGQIRIATADAVTIDLQGYTLYGSINVERGLATGSVLLKNGTMADFFYSGAGTSTVQNVRFTGTSSPFGWGVVADGPVSITDSTFSNVLVRAEPNARLNVQRSVFLGAGVSVFESFVNLRANTFSGGGGIFMDQSDATIIHNVLYGGSINLLAEQYPSVYRVGGNTVIGSGSYAIWSDQPIVDLGGNKVAHIAAKPPCINIVCTPL